MDEISISLKKLHGIPLGLGWDDNKADSRQLVYALNVEMMRLGFVMTAELVRVMCKVSNLESLGTKIISCLREVKGDDVTYNPMYPNFPQQVMEACNLELYFNALIHYWTHGTWNLEYTKLPRKFELENVKFRKINLLDEDDFTALFPTLLSSNDSLSSEDKDIVKWFLTSGQSLRFPDTIPHKETLCIVTAELLKQDMNIDYDFLIKTATDVLRLVTYLSGGDTSLAENTKFKSLPRRLRRKIVRALENVINEEDIQRHRNKWVRLFHNLHVGEYSEKVRLIAEKVRNNEKLETMAGKVQVAIDNNNYLFAALLLTKRPGEFARRLDHLLREYDVDPHIIINEFLVIAPEVSTRVLMQLLGHFKGRLDNGIRVVFPKGSTQKARVIPKYDKLISYKTITTLMTGISHVLRQRFAKLEPLGKVCIDKRLQKCPLPTQQRSSSIGLDVVARGTRLPIGGTDNTLRFFIYWIGIDIDLSATLHDDKFEMIERISYTNLKSRRYNACHSGDIVSAPNGASEFIDITMDKALKSGARYVAMSVLVYSGENFDKHEKCYAGWMTRSKPNSNEMYDPKTVVSKIDITAASKNAIPVIFDLKTREAIWCDLVTKKPSYHSLVDNNVESNQASIKDVLKSITSLGSKSTLYDLFTLHIEARGILVENIEDADIVFGIDGNVSPRDINVINAEYLS